MKTKKRSKWKIPSLCISCQYKCSLRILQDSKLISCNKYKRLKRVKEDSKHPK